MIIRHLPYFAVAAEEENLQRAAARLGISQPALSRRIQDLENELGILLFERVSGRLKLTPLGRHLASESRRLVDDVDALVRDMRAHSEQGRARLAIGMNERAIAIDAVGSALRKFRNDNPAIELTVKIMPSTRQMTALKERQVDIALMYLDDNDTSLRSEKIESDDPFLLIVPEEHRLAKLRQVCLADLDGEDLIWPSRERIPVSYDHLLSKWHEHGMEPRVTTEVGSSDAALHAVKAGLGVSLLRSSVVPPDFAGLSFRTVEELSADPIGLSVVWVDLHSTVAMRRFLKLLGEFDLIEMPRDPV